MTSVQPPDSGTSPRTGKPLSDAEQKPLVRLPPLPSEQWGESEYAALAPLVPAERRNPRTVGNSLGTLVRHPELTRNYLHFGNYLLFHTTLPARVRELAILRVVTRRHCAYEWAQHVRIAEQAGLTKGDIEAARHGEASDKLGTAVLAAVDELDDGTTISDLTWAVLSEHLDERQRMDLVFTVGNYCLLAMAYGAFGVEPDPEE